MINLIRKVVAGPKNRTVQKQYDLDLTYITPNIIAMAFPAAGFEKTYRNSITDVASFLKERHDNHYLIINASNRKYQYDKFNHQVLEFFWTDHQAPPITTLFEVCDNMHKFLAGTLCFNLEDARNVVAVHCNHGKGRTGTAIIAYMIYSNPQKYSSVKQALDVYNSKRFAQGSKYGVDQPCQLRYLNYFKVYSQSPLSVLSRPLVAYKLSKVQQSGYLKEKQLFLRIFETRTQHLIYSQVLVTQGCYKSIINFSRPLLNDIFIEVYESGWSGDKIISKINMNLFFLQKRTDGTAEHKKAKTNSPLRTIYYADFKGDSIKMKQDIKDFSLHIQFQEFCHCHRHVAKAHTKDHSLNSCLCAIKRQREQVYWDNMCKIIKSHRQELGLNQQNPCIKLQEQKLITDQQPKMNIEQSKIDIVQQTKTDMEQQPKIDMKQQPKMEMKLQPERAMEQQAKMDMEQQQQTKEKVASLQSSDSQKEQEQSQQKQLIQQNKSLGK